MLCGRDRQALFEHGADRRENVYRRLRNVDGFDQFLRKRREGFVHFAFEDDQALANQRFAGVVMAILQNRATMQASDQNFEIRAMQQQYCLH